MFCVSHAFCVGQWKTKSAWEIHWFTAATKHNIRTICFVLEDSLLRMNLKLENVHGQYYDGVASMDNSKFKFSVSSWTKQLKERILYTNCYMHVLNFAIGDFTESVLSIYETFWQSIWNMQISKTVSAKKNIKLNAIRNSSKNHLKIVHKWFKNKMNNAWRSITVASRKFWRSDGTSKLIIGCSKGQRWKPKSVELLLA